MTFQTQEKDKQKNVNLSFPSFSSGGLGGMGIGFGGFMTNFMGGPPVSAPFLEKQKNFKAFTLVLDLDETLVHFFYTPSGGTFLVRPFAHEFLMQMSEYYEIVIFTAAMKDVIIFFTFSTLITS